MTLKRKILVIGLDGATWRVINPLLDAGKLPALRQIAGQGCSAVLNSTVPPCSAVAWPSFLTGCGPGRHGLYQFYRFQRNSYAMRLNSMCTISEPKIWNLLGDYGLKTGVVNVPMTYPPEPLNGFLISGMLLPSHEVAFTYPPDLFAELDSRVGFYRHEKGLLTAFRAGHRRKALTELHRLSREQANVVRHLLERGEWDLFITVFRASDLLQHVLGKLWHPEVQRLNPLEYREFHEAIPQLYEELDRIIAELVAAAPSDCSVFIMSDHGAVAMQGQFFINQWLIERQWLRVGSPDALWRFNLQKRSRRARRLKRSRPEHAPTSSERHAHASPLSPYDEAIDWRRSIAYADWQNNQTAAIRLNLAGREPLGIVQPGREADERLAEIAAALRTVLLPDSRPLFKEVVQARDLYSGPQTEPAPDLIAIPENYEFNIVGRIPTAQTMLMNPMINAQHHPEGILFASGPAIKPGSVPHHPSIVDLLPTFLAILGIPAPSHLDGRALREIIPESFLAAPPIAPVISPSQFVPRTDDSVFSKDEELALEMHLRSLGYVE